LRIATFDCEADGLLEEATRVWCIVVKDHETGNVQTFGPDNITSGLICLSTFDALIGHNAIGYDFPLLRKLHGWEYKGEKIDTLLMSRMQRPLRSYPPRFPNKAAGPHSVEAWGFRLGKHKVQNEDWSQFTPLMLERCVQDCEIQYGIYLALLEEGAGEGWERAHKLNHKLFHYLEMQERHGWLVDRHHLDKCLHTLDRWIDRINRAIGPRLPLLAEPQETKVDGEYNYVRKPFRKDGSYAEIVQRVFPGGTGDVGGCFSRVGFRPVDLDSNKETKAFLLALGWEPLEWNVNNDGERTSPKLSKNDDFNGIQGSLGRLVAKRIQCRQRKGVIEGWRDSIRADGRIAAQVNGVATTGRLKHKGIVNVPSPTTKSFFAKSMRRLFISQPGWKLIGVDSKSNQVRQLAARIDDPAFTKFVLTGENIHERNMKLSGVPTKTIAKNLYYGTIFGAGDTKIGKLVGGGAKEGKALKEKFFTALPTLPPWLEQEQIKWRKTASSYWNPRFRKMEYQNGFITGLDGRPILVENEKDILCFYLQSDESVQMAAAYCWSHKQLEKKGYVYGKDYGLCIWMHDEFQAEAREEIAQEVAEILAESIAWAGRYFKIKCPHEGDIKIGNNWCDTH
jgi:DNA polymerase-1